MKIKNPSTDFNFPYPYKRILIFPERVLRSTILEMAMIDTRIFQRLRNTKQLGNSNVSYPTADHSRFAHSLGVLYWSTKILTSLNDNHNASHNTTILKELDDVIKNYLKQKLPSLNSKIFDNEKFLGITWFEQLVRLYALLHDLSHIPYGHTLEDQARLFERHDEDLSRLYFCFDLLKKEITKSYHFENINLDNELSQIATEYVNLVQLIFVIGTITSDSDLNESNRKEWIKEWEKIDEQIKKPLLLTYDIVSNTICADLMDYTLRDTLYASMPKTFDKALLTYMKIVKQKTIFFLPEKKSEYMFRLGVNISRKKVRHDIITAILELLRIRYDLTEKVYYHHTKVITDIMLEKILRSLPTEKNPINFTAEEIKSLEFTPYDIYEQYLGDEGFLNLLENKLKKDSKLANSLEILNKIFRRNLYKAVFRINRNEPLSRVGKNNLNKCCTPDGRNQMEEEIIKELSEKYRANIEKGDIIISYPPEKMQLKVAKALIEWSDGQIFTFEDLPMETNYSNEVGLLTERYKTLWSMTVFLNPQKIEYIRLVESLCENKFDIHNESILKNYLKERYVDFYESQQTMTEIKHRVITIEAPQIKSRAAKGGSHLGKDEKIEMTEIAFEQTINERRKPKKNKANEKKEDDSQKLDFNDTL